MAPCGPREGSVRSGGLVEVIKRSGSGHAVKEGAALASGLHMRRPVESVPDREVGYLKQALALATENGARGRRPFASILVIRGEAVSAQVDEEQEASDETVCSEVLTIRAAIAERGAAALHGGVLYCSAEPCTLCKRAIDWAGLRRVVFAAQRSVALGFGFDDPFFATLAAAGHDLPNAELVEHPIGGIDESFLAFQRFHAPAAHPS